MADSPPPPPTSQTSGAPGYDNSNLIILNELKRYSSELEDQIGGDSLTIISPITFGLEDVVREQVEGRSQKRTKLVVLLETQGGFIEVAQRIANTLRHHYREVEFIIPNFAMSAGTVLAMSGDAIWMDYYSVLGPIDPQVERPDGRTVPALGYLLQYDRLIAKAKAGKLTSAEITYLISNFDPAELYRYEQARDLSIALLKEWLVKYKFKNWKKTETRKKKVTPAMKTARAKQIALILQDTSLWNSHGRGISMEVLKRDVNLLIDDFGADSELHVRVRRYYRLVKDFMGKTGFSSVLCWGEHFVPLATR